MNQTQIHPIDELDGASRVWVYQSDRPFTDEEVAQLEAVLQRFVSRWVSHNRALRAAATVLYERFIVLAVDEQQAGASGCSIDASVHFLKQLQAQLGIDLFDRMQFSYQDASGKIETLPRDAFATAYSGGTINDQTFVFDPLVKTLEELRSQFRKPLQDSWHRQMV